MALRESQLKVSWFLRAGSLHTYCQPVGTQRGYSSAAAKGSAVLLCVDTEGGHRLTSCCAAGGRRQRHSHEGQVASGGAEEGAAGPGGRGPITATGQGALLRGRQRCRLAAAAESLLRLSSRHEHGIAHSLHAFNLNAACAVCQKEVWHTRCHSLARCPLGSCYRYGKDYIRLQSCRL